MNPEVSDPWIALGDLVVCGFIAPAIGVLFLARTDLYLPAWVAAATAAGQPLATASLAHGGKLATCWTFGAVATGAFSEGAVDSDNLVNTLRRTWFAGSFAAALLALFAVVGAVVGCEGGVCPDPAGNLPSAIVDTIIESQVLVSCLVAWRFSRAVDSAELPAPQTSVADRLLSPQIAGPRLVLGDLVASGIMVPAMVVVFLVQTDVYTPEWYIVGGGLERGPFAPALAHGAGLALCWVNGALLTGAFEGGAAFGKGGLSETIKRVSAAGAAATALLALATGLGLLVTLGPARMADPGDIDASRIVGRTFFDFMVDVPLEAAWLSMWRLAYAGFL